MQRSGLEDLWQIHFSLLSGQEYTGPGAAPPPAHNGAAYWIKVSAKEDGSFSVTNTRNGFSKTYAKR